MELQKQIINGIFRTINAYPTTKTKDNQILSEIKVSLAKFDVDTHLLILTSRCLYLQKIGKNHSKSIGNQIYAANIDFQLNFQLQSAVQNNINSKKNGISFFKGPNSIRLYSLDQFGIFIFRNQLMRFINERRFHEQYVPYDKLGKGSFATVYAVFNTQTREKFAVKAFSKSNIYRIQSGKQALKNQLQIMRTVSHSSKNLLSLYGIYETFNSIYAVQTLLEGKSLQYLISRERTAGFSYDQTRYIMLGILNAVKVLHRMKIMHRDLKPENVIFKKQTMNSPQQYDPVIVDYGMCQNYQKINYIFFRCGTPGYVAPEVGRLQNNTPYSAACDMFSVGCLFHLIMTGCPIFDSRDQQEILKKNLLFEFTIKKNRVKRKHPLAMALLARLLEPIPSKRITAQQALQNDFFGNLKVMRTYTYNNKIEQKQIFSPSDNQQNQQNQQKNMKKPKQQTQSLKQTKKPQIQIMNISHRPVSPQHQIMKCLSPQSQENILTSPTLTSTKSTEMLIEVSPTKKRFAF